MKLNQWLLTSASVVVLLTTPSAFAATSLTKACKSDLKTFGCTAKTDAEAHECLEKNEKQAEKNEGFSAGCYKAHEAFEKKQGKGEKEEHHEHTEKSESH